MIIYFSVFAFTTIVALAVLVFFRAPGNRLHISYAALNLSLAVWVLWDLISALLPQTEPGLALTLSRACYLAAVFVPILYLHFVYTLIGINRKVMMGLGYFATAVVLASVPTEFFINGVQTTVSFGTVRFQTAGSMFFDVFTALYFASAVAGIVELIMAGARESGRKRVQIGYFLLASAIAYSAGPIYFLSLFGWQVPPVDNLLLSIYAIVIAVAILKNRLIDISMVIKKTTAYSMVTTGITLVYLLVVMGFEYLFRSMYGFYSFWAAVPAALVISVTFMPVRGRLQKVADNVFFRRTIEYQNTVREITKLIATVIDIETLFRLVDRTIVRVMCISNASVLLLEEKEDHYIVEKVNGLPEKALGIRIERGNPLVAYLKDKKDAAVKEELKTILQTTSSGAIRENLSMVLDEMQKFEAHVSVPSFCRSKLVGILNLGEKLSGEPYAPEDLELLLTLASEAGIAIENSKLYRDATETRNYLNSLIQNSDDAIITLDLKGEVLSWNSGAAKIFGYGPKDVEGGGLPFFSAGEIKDLTGRIVSGEEIKTFEAAKMEKTGEEVPVLVTISPIMGSAGEVVGISLILNDISELKRVERMKSEFLAVISHELKTPLTPIIEYLDMLNRRIKGDLNEEQLRMIGTISKQVFQLDRLIDSLLELTLIESGRPLELNKELISMNRIVEDVHETFRPQLEEKEFSLVKDIPDVMTIMGDKNKLMRLFSNLIGNSIKFAPRKGKISVICRYLEKDLIEIQVADNGIGVENKYLERIFDKFFQADSAYSRSFGGAGLGLAVAQKIVEAHGGRIRAESGGVGKGLNIAITMPIGI